MLNSEVKEKWVAALESDRYEQCKGALKFRMYSEEDECERFGYCCLGVLLEELYQGGFDNQTEDDDYQEFYAEINGKTVTAAISLPDIIADEIGLDHATVRTLILMNDGQNKSFREIAEYIREL